MSYVDEMLELSRAAKRKSKKTLKLKEEIESRKTGWAVVELNPAPWVKGPKDEIKVLHLFDRKEDAEHVLKALTWVNNDFHLYQLKEFYRD